MIQIYKSSMIIMTLKCNLNHDTFIIARDTWCSERTQKFPSGNRAEPDEVPLEFRKHRTPPPSGKEEVNSGADMHFISLLAFILLQAIVAFYLSW